MIQTFLKEIDCMAFKVPEPASPGSPEAIDGRMEMGRFPFKGMIWGYPIGSETPRKMDGLIG